MTKESLDRGNLIQTDLGYLTRQLDNLNKPNKSLLRELEHQCDYSLIESGKDINEKVVEYAKKLVGERINKLQREFKNL